MRRCAHNQYLLRPGKKTNNIIKFCLGMAKRKYAVEVVGMMVMSDYYCALYYDPDGEIPEFLAYFHRLVAATMNRYLRRSQNFWASEQGDRITCDGRDDVFDKLIALYTLPVKYHLVDRVVNWPGVNSLSAQLYNKKMKCTRPTYYFTKHGCMPEHAEIVFSRPNCFEHMSDVEWRAAIHKRIEEAERKAAAERKATGGKVLGRKAIVRQSVTYAPRNPTSSGRLKRSKWQKAAVFVREKVFRKLYAKAFALLQRGYRDVLFPAGTYQLRVLKLACCEPFPDSG